jgi:hypothetical protein
VVHEFSTGAPDPPGIAAGMFDAALALEAPEGAGRGPATSIWCRAAGLVNVEAGEIA